MSFHDPIMLAQAVQVIARMQCRHVDDEEPPCDDCCDAALLYLQRHSLPAYIVPKIADA